ncbi:hypothetical protein TWF694_003980 [Orbilia ellipsospora]|uniref:Uncharacterized protein n=1 Tax=Orbilia ellipsospora TaxID=2528407 RepID=A0AAV9WZ64_9PEZI
MPATNIKWTPDNDRLLLLAILAASPPIDVATVAFHAGLTVNNVQWRLYTLRKNAAKMRISAGGEASPIIPSKKRATSDSRTSSPIKKRKVAPIAKRGRKRNLKIEDTSDEESLMSKLEDDSEEEQTPSLVDEDGRDETGPSSIEPETPIKNLPRRRVKLEPGSYKKLDEGSELEFDDDGEEWFE